MIDGERNDKFSPRRCKNTDRQLLIVRIHSQLLEVATEIIYKPN